MKRLQQWLSTYKQILISPNEATFLEESCKAEGKTLEAFLWLIFILILRFLIIYLFEDSDSFEFIVGGLFAFTLLIGYVVWVFSIDYVVVKLFNQERIIDSLIYITTSVLVVAFIVLQIIAAIPGISNLLGFVAYIYIAYLLYKGVRALSGLSSWKALTSLLIGSILATVVGVSLFALLINGFEAIIRIIL
jgi:hypothetical protein